MHMHTVTKRRTRRRTRPRGASGKSRTPSSLSATTISEEDRILPRLGDVVDERRHDAADDIADQQRHDQIHPAEIGDPLTRADEDE